MSKFAGRFPKETDHTEEYTYERKKRDKQIDSNKQSKYFDSHESNWTTSSKRHKNEY